MKIKRILLGLSLACLATTYSQAQVKVGKAPGTIGSNEYLEIQADNDAKVIVKKDNGYVGINTSTPETRLHVNGDFKTTGDVYFNNTAGTQSFYYNSTGETFNFYKETHIRYQQLIAESGMTSFGNFTLKTGAGATSLYLDGLNNVLYTTASSFSHNGGDFNVNGTGNFITGVYSKLNNGFESIGNASLKSASGANGLVLDGTNNILYSTAQSFNHNGGDFNVNGTGSFITGVYSKFSKGFQSNGNVYLLNTGGGNGVVYDATNNAFSLLANGTYYGSWTNGSDVRLKKDIKPLGSVINKIDAINTYTYKYRVGEVKQLDGANPNTQIGVMAQEVEKVFPSMVSKNGEYKTVSYDKLAVVALQAVKELKEQVEALRKENVSLKEVASRTRESQRAYAQLAKQVKDMQGLLGINAKAKTATKGVAFK